MRTLRVELRRLGILTSAVVLSLGCTAGSAGAQEAPGRVVLEEIVVTATKRAQSIRDVPIAVTAITQDALDKAGISDVRELTQLAPSLFLSSSASEAAGAVARVRGVGTTGDNAGLESSVAIFIDGIYRNRTNVGLSELGEIERVEVLRGPQGTLFGRNASAGLINIVTAGPKSEPGGYAEFSYGNYNALRLAAGVTGPISDKVAARVDGVYFQRDGFLDDKGNGEEYNDRDRYLVRGQMLFDPSDSLSIRLIADYTKRDEDCCAAVTIRRGATAGVIEALGGQLGSGGSPAGSDPYDRESATSVGRGFQQDVREYGFSGEITWEGDGLNLTSLTAYRDWKNWRSQDIDFSSADILYRDEDGAITQFQTFTQEVRLNGQFKWLDWMIGGYFANEDLSLDDAIRVGRDYLGYADFLVRASSPTFPGYRPLTSLLSGGAVTNALAEGQGVVNDQFEQNSRNWALFTHEIISLTDNLQLTLGVRYTEERKKLDVDLLANNPTCTTLVAAARAGAIPASLLTLPCLPFFNSAVDGTYDGSIKESEVTGTAALNYVIGDNASTYISYSRGYKAGGFNLDRAALSSAAPSVERDLPFDPEIVNAYEFGAKFSSDDRTFTSNLAVFYSKFEDFQLNTFNGISFVVENLPEVVTKGFEVEASYLPTDQLTLSGGLTYADTKYGDDLVGAIFAQPSAANPAGGALWQLAGQQITNAPKWSVTGSGSYEHPINANLYALLYLDFRYTSEINTGSDLDLEKVQEGLFIVNGRIGLGSDSSGWRADFWVRNIFDKEYIQVAFDAPLQGSGTARNTLLPNSQTFNAFLAEPRTFGITLRKDF